MESGCLVISVSAAYCPVKENGASGRQAAGETDKGEATIPARQQQQDL
jgi:hypothetical protein